MACNGLSIVLHVFPSRQAKTQLRSRGIAQRRRCLDLISSESQVPTFTGYVRDFHQLFVVNLNEKK